MALSELIAAPAGAPTADAGGLLVMTYDPTGLLNVKVQAWPLLGWNIDAANPIDSSPITIGNPLKTPPNTGTVDSPAWALIITENAVFVPDIWSGTLTDFFTWLATNHGANRYLSCAPGYPRIVNVWNQWSRDNPNLVVEPTQQVK